MQFLKAENTSSHRSLGTRTLQFNREIKLTNKNSAKINQKFTVRQKGGGGRSHHRTCPEYATDDLSLSIRLLTSYVDFWLC